MKLLFDENLSFRLCEYLGDLFPESSQVRLLKLDRTEDRALWNYARVNGFVLVSLDSDFADLAALLGPPPKVIWLRCGNQRTETIARLLRKHAQSISDFQKDDLAFLEIY